jgi:flagellar biosynthesis protein FlhF
MRLICFIAENANAALAEVHRRLGPDAVIVSVRQVPALGLGKFLQKKGQIEVTAGIPDKTSAPQLKKFVPPENFTGDPGITDADRWRSIAWLESMGLLPQHAERLQTQLRTACGNPPDSVDDEWRIVSGALTRLWIAPPPLEYGDSRPHVFIGPPGSGKTTALCKWLTVATLLEERPARVWRLDGHITNTAEYLAIHCETLGVPLERFWSAPKTSGELWFVDLPGVEASDSIALAALREQLADLPAPRVHLVLNAAYEMPALLAQWRAFELCCPEDFIFTHLDEESHRIKLWNFVFGTNCSLRFLGAGQKIPGDFRNASPELLLPAKSL